VLQHLPNKSKAQVQTPVPPQNKKEEREKKKGGIGDFSVLQPLARAESRCPDGIRDQRRGLWGLCFGLRGNTKGPLRLIILIN
jgi:hypothetical protein